VFCGVSGCGCVGVLLPRYSQCRFYYTQLAPFVLTQTPASSSMTHTHTHNTKKQHTHTQKTTTNRLESRIAYFQTSELGASVSQVEQRLAAHDAFQGQVGEMERDERERGGRMAGRVMRQNTNLPPPLPPNTHATPCDTIIRSRSTPPSSPSASAWWRRSRC
jgi:hypothetical protein